jgi:hypothetical protein
MRSCPALQRLAARESRPTSKEKILSFRHFCGEAAGPARICELCTSFSRRFPYGQSTCQAQNFVDSATMASTSARVVVKLQISGNNNMQSTERRVSLYDDANFGRGTRAWHIRLADSISVPGTPNHVRILRLQVELLSHTDQKPFVCNFTSFHHSSFHYSYRSQSSLQDCESLNDVLNPGLSFSSAVSFRQRIMTSSHTSLLLEKSFGSMPPNV